jgi:hypothetical protein
MLSECNEISRNSQHMMTDHEESFLKDFFTHVASLSFDKAKELVVSFIFLGYEVQRGPELYFSMLALLFTQLPAFYGTRSLVTVFSRPHQ